MIQTNYLKHRTYSVLDEAPPCSLPDSFLAKAHVGNGSLAYTPNLIKIIT
jgi:hypothetical protein